MKIANQTECTACMACIDACAHSVLKARIDSDGYYSVGIENKDACVECGRCTNVCPVPGISKPEGFSVPYAAWNLDRRQRKLSASGGVFAALATTIFHKGGSVYGAAVDGFDIIHKRITKEEDLPLLQGSKYQHSVMTGVYRQVRNDLRQGMYVLFSGLGCQVAGLLSFLGNMNKEKLYTVDTICGGLSTMLPMLHLKESGKYKGICSFRDKGNGWQSVGFRYSLKMIRMDDGIEELGLDNMVLNTFSSKLLKRSSCLDCKFTGFHRISDCTIGDFWGDKRFKDQHEQGLSVLITHSGRINDLIAEADLQTTPVTWNEVTAGNHNIYWTHYPLIRHFKSRKIALKAIQKGEYPTAMRQMSPWSIAGLPLRIYLKINALWRKRSFFRAILNIKTH